MAWRALRCNWIVGLSIQLCRKGGQSRKQLLSVMDEIGVSMVFGGRMMELQIARR